MRACPRRSWAAATFSRVTVFPTAAGNSSLKVIPPARRTVDLDRAVVCPDDPQRCGQAQPSPRKLCSKKGIKDLGDRLLVHSAAGVLDFGKDVWAGTNFRVQEYGAQVCFVHVNLSGGHAEGTGPIANGLGPVDHEIHD